MLKISKIPTHRKILLIIFSINSFAIILVAILFIIAYYYLGAQQLRQTLLIEAEEIATQHIGFDKDRILLRNNENGNTIKQDLSADGVSALILNKSMDKVGIFGISDTANTWETDLDYKGVSTEVLINNRYTFRSHHVITSGKSYEVIFYPIRRHNEPIGILVMATKTDFFHELLELSSKIYIIVIPIMFIINFYLSFLIIRIVYDPVKKLITKMNTVDLDNIGGKVNPEGHSNDITYRLAVKYNKMISRVRESSIKQRQFISNASHELKSPIARAVSSLDVIKSELLEDRKHSSYNMANINLVQRDLIDLSELINDMLTIAKIKEENNIYTSINLREIVTQIINKFDGSQITNSIHKGTIIDFNKGFFKIILINLVENAIKYGIKDTSRISTIIHKDSLTILVSNEFKQKYNIKKAQIFNRFFTTSPKKNGSYGLGLSIIKSIADRESLTISVDIVKNKFTVKVSGFKMRSQAN